MSNVCLLYFSSAEIMRFCGDHPLDWSGKELVKRGGVADRAGMTPTPAVQEFLNCPHWHQQLFDQAEYWSWCQRQHLWSEWLSRLTDEQKQAVKARCYRNFYPSMIDSLHVWAMLVESGEYDSCAVDSARDAVGKTDLTVSKGPEVKRIALVIGSPEGRADREYKLKYRATPDGVECIDIYLDKEHRPVGIGNKRWYNIGDLQDVLCAPVEYEWER